MKIKILVFLFLQTVIFGLIASNEHTEIIQSQEKTDAMLFGHVTSAETGEHLPYATIQIKGTTCGTHADGSGHFKLSNIPTGKQIVEVKLFGYKTLEQELFFEKGKAIKFYPELETDALNLEQVVVTGTRTQHHIKNVPIRTEVISKNSIKNKNAINLFQALENIPGIRVENQCQACNFTMVRMQGLGAEHTQVLLNGQPMYSGLAGVYGLQQMTTLDVERIEVVKGAGSALYGSSAVAGAINIITSEPSFVPSTKAEVQIGNFNTNIMSISSSMRNEKGNLGLNVYAQRKSEGVIDATGEGLTHAEVKKKDGISDRVASKLNNLGFALHADKPFFKDDKLILRGKMLSENRAGGMIDNDYYKNPFTDGTENIETDRYEAELSYEKRLGKNKELNFSAAYVNHNRNATNDSYLNDYMDTHGGDTPDLLTMRPYIAKENSFNSALTFTSKWGNHNFLAGVQAYLTDYNETGLYVVVDEESSYLGKSYKSTGEKFAREFGAFMQDEWNITDKLTVVPGIRFDYHKSGEKYNSSEKVFDKEFPATDFEQNSFNPRLAIKYNVLPSLILRANVGTGFRAPYGFSEDLHLCSGSPRVWKSSDLEPEKSISFNFSADYYGKIIRASANVFRTNLKNKIDFADAEATAKSLGYDYEWKNIDDAFVQGAELSIIAMLHRDFNAGIDFTINQGEYKNPRSDWVGTEYESVSKFIPRFASTTGNFKMEYTPRTWTFTWTTGYQGRMYIDYIAEEEADRKIKHTSPFLLSNVRAAKRLGAFQIYAGANNIFNYTQDERHLDDAAFIYAPVYGTTVYAGISVDINH